MADNKKHNYEFHSRNLPASNTNYSSLSHYFSTNAAQQVITVLLFFFKSPLKATVFLFNYKETHSGTNKIGAICDGREFTAGFEKHRKWGGNVLVDSFASAVCGLVEK